MKITLKAARINAGFSLIDIANRLNVSDNTIMNWESGKTLIPAKALFELCELYGAPIEFIILP